MFQSSYVLWSVVLLLFVPLSIILLNEYIDRSQRNSGSYVNILTTIRNFVLPLTVLVVLLRLVFEIDDENLPAKFLSTLLWLVLGVTVFKLSRLVIGSGNYEENDWRKAVPHMFMRLPSYSIMGFIVFHIVQNLWSFPIREMATTLGIGSIVIAFALQDTLSNLVSGVLLVANSPFKTGDWVQVGDVEGKIIAVNWRYTNIENWSGNLVVIPNGSIAGESIQNFSRPARNATIAQRFTLSYTHAPSKVNAMFEEVLSDTPGILDTPSPTISITAVDDPAMEYEVEFWIQDYADKFDIHAEFMKRIWYALRRHNLSLPTPVYDIHSYNGDRLNSKGQTRAHSISQLLEKLPLFSSLSVDVKTKLAEISSFMLYAQNEIVLNRGATELGVYVIVSGSAQIERTDSANSPAETTILYAGDFFGETGLFGRATSQITATAMEDCELLICPHDFINETINRNPRFSTEINTIIEYRRESDYRSAKVGIPDAANQSMLAIDITTGD